MRSIKVALSRKLLPAAISPRRGGGGVAYGLDVWSMNNPVAPPGGCSILNITAIIK